MRLRNLFAVVAASCSMATASRAQLADLLPGARVRVQAVANTKRVDGTIIARGPDSIVVATLRGEQYPTPLVALRSVDVYRGRSRVLGAEKGAVWGAAVIAVPLAVAFAAANPKRDGWSRADELRFSFWAIRVYAYTGAVIGAFVRAERWEHCAAATAPTCASR